MPPARSRPRKPQRRSPHQGRGEGRPGGAYRTPGGIMKLRMLLAILCLIATLPYRATAQQDRSPDSVSDFQKDFAEAYDRGDVDAMAGHSPRAPSG
jgi:hypothetical protein